MTEYILGRKLSELEAGTFSSALFDKGRNDKVAHSQINALSVASSMSLPGIPDEAWRRIDLSSLNLNRYSLSRARTTIMCGAPGSYFAYGLILNETENAIGSEREVLDSFLLNFYNIENDIDRKSRERANNVVQTIFSKYAEALPETGLFIRVPKRVSLPNPIHIEFSFEQSDALYIPHVFVLVEEGSSLNLCIHYKHSDENALIIPYIKAIVSPNASLNVFSMDTGEALRTNSFPVEKIAVMEGGKFSRDMISESMPHSLRTLEYSLIGEKSSCLLNALLTANRQDTTALKVSINHLARESKSFSKVYTLGEDASKSVVLTNIYIPQGSVQSEGHEESACFIRAEAKAQSIPELEIIENDVVCSHGSSVESIQSERMHALMLRGIKAEEAEKMLVSSFCQNAISPMKAISSEKRVRESMANSQAFASLFENEEEV